MWNYLASVPSETCTELATTLTILVPSPNPAQYDNLTIQSATGDNFEDGEQLQVLTIVSDFNNKLVKSFTTKADQHHNIKYMAEKYT